MGFKGFGVLGFGVGVFGFWRALTGLVSRVLLIILWFERVLSAMM